MRKLLKELFYIPKYGKMSEKVFLSNIAISIVGIVLCLSTMALTAYAYYSWSLITPTQIIQAGYYECTVEIEKISEVTDNSDLATDDETIILEGTDIVLEAGTYRITITKAENSTTSTGFCVMSVAGEDYYTVQIDKTEEPVSFVLRINAELTVSFTPCWGTSSKYGMDAKTEESYIEAGETVSVEVPQNNLLLGMPQESTEETTVPSASTEAISESSEETEPRYVILEEGDTLFSIEQEYGIDRAKIKAYNGIEDVTSLQIGEKIWLPPDDYEIPVTTETSEATATQTSAATTTEEETKPATEPTEPPTEPTEPATVSTTVPTAESTAGSAEAQ